MKISENEWNEGKSLENGEKFGKIVELFSKGEMMDVKEVRKLSGEKWVWSSLEKGVESGVLECKKIGKKKFYRKKK
jgi:hypothetical protein